MKHSLLLIALIFSFIPAAAAAQVSTAHAGRKSVTHQPEQSATRTKDTSGTPTAHGSFENETGTSVAQSAETSPAPTAGKSGIHEPAPPFIVASLDDTTRYIGNQSFEGKVYLVDFWATWCPPCVAALPELEKIYRQYHSRGFEILSLSFDSSNDRIRRFRKTRFAMPWKHGRLAGGFNDVVSISFHLENIPHYVLVGRDSMIIAEGDDLHGDQLRKLLDENL